MKAITKNQLHILKHSLGLDGRHTKPWRNYFAADDCGQDYVDICRLVEMGLMVQGNGIPGGLVYYHVTDEGKGVGNETAIFWPCE